MWAGSKVFSNKILVWISAAGAIALLLFLLFAQPAWSAIAQPERVLLTPELLQQRLKTPSLIEGVSTIDLRRMVIDLRPESNLRDVFYSALKPQLQRTGPPLGLDLSYSLVQGELKVSELGLRAPLYGDSFSSTFSESEQAQLKRDRRRIAQLSQLSRSLLIQNQPPTLQITILRGPLRLMQTRFEGFVNFTNTFFLGRLEAAGADFAKESDWTETRFSLPTSFAGAIFRQPARFRNAIFFDRVGFNQVQFQSAVTFQGSEFQASVNFSRATFQKTANFSRIQWQSNADFAQTQWQDAAIFSRDKFTQALFLSEAQFEKLVTFRETQFEQPVNLRGASILDQLDLGDTLFSKAAYLNVTELQFNPYQAKILGNPGEVGRVFSVPTLRGNETLLRNLRRNFRLQEQIPDENQLEYLRQKLRLKQLRQQIWGTNLNTASAGQLKRLGFSSEQANDIIQARTSQPFRSLNDLLKLPRIDLATFVRVREQVVAIAPHSTLPSLGESLLSRLGSVIRWLGLNLLLLLTRYGTSASLTLGVGMVAIAFFSLLFWLIDRFRRLTPAPIVPTLEESLWNILGVGLFGAIGLAAIFRAAEAPWLSLLYLAIVTLPIPALLTFLLYRRGRYHDLMDSSYFVEDGSMRQLRVLIGRLPNIPKYPFFRERYTPIPWKKRWNWLNYLDFSLNNLLKIGFNDIRLRDEHMPGLVMAIAWYQWSLGMLYLSLLLWTLSRTIPGLNLLIYLK